jgi:2-oxoglutarate ferredoxin oxidoreductase subunit alpha
MRNTVALGAGCALLDFPPQHLAEVMTDAFARKGKKVVALNAAVLMAGYRALSATQRKKFPWSIRPVKPRQPQALFTGNDALSMGAIQAGCQLYSGYPMTPASSILHFLAEHGPKFGLIVRHAEDEIAAIHHAIGAAYTGVRAMTATAGGGFSLMTEAVGMAAMTEVGIVIVEAQRGGPSTGLPTWTEQGDLRQVLHASQGDFPRIVLAPSSHLECFSLMQAAFNLADVYQTPVIVMTDKYLAEGFRNVTIADLKPQPITRGKILSKVGPQKAGAFSRYRTDVADGIAPRTLPGTPHGLFLANSDEHDEFGYSNEDIPMRLGQMERRARKIETLQKHILPPRFCGPEDAPLTVVTWGSSAGAVEAALRILEQDHGLHANAMIPTMIAPFPSDLVKAKLGLSQHTVIVEANQSGQLAGWIRQQTGYSFDQAINRFDGRPFDPTELATQFAKIITAA